MKKRWLLPLAVILMLPLTACNTDENDAEGTPDENQENVDQDIGEEEESNQDEEDTEEDQKNRDRATVVDGVNYSDAKVTPQDAFDTFMDSHGDAKITEVKLDTKYDELEYKIEGYNDNSEFQMRIDAVSGDIKDDETKNIDEDDKDDDVITKEDIAKVEDAVDKGMNEADNDLKFKKWSLEDDDGQLEFEIEFKDSEDNDAEYTYDLNSGELIEEGD